MEILKKLRKDYGKNIRVSTETHKWLTKNAKLRRMSVDDFIQALRFGVVKV